MRNETLVIVKKKKEVKWNWQRFACNPRNSWITKRINTVFPNLKIGLFDKSQKRSPPFDIVKLFDPAIHETFKFLYTCRLVSRKIPALTHPLWTIIQNSSWNETLNLLIRIKFLNLFLYNIKFTGLDNVLLFLGCRTGAHREECRHGFQYVNHINFPQTENALQ